MTTRRPAPAGISTITVKLVETGCGERTYAAQAGKLRFVAENTTARDAEFEIIAPGPVIVAEQDPIEAGKSATLTESLAAGEYELRCALGSDAKTSTLTVTGEGGGAVLKVNRAALDAAVAQYQSFILEQTDLLQASTQEFATAVESGNVEQAKALYAPGRIPWETIEPVAELFPDADAAIDSRVDDHEGPDDPEWTGWHRIEKGLWDDNSTEGLTPFAQQLVTDTDNLVAEVQALTIEPGVMTNGAAALIEEAAEGKITGEEERYSHTDLITFTGERRRSKEDRRAADAGALHRAKWHRAAHRDQREVRHGRRDRRSVPAGRNLRVVRAGERREPRPAQGGDGRPVRGAGGDLRHDGPQGAMSEAFAMPLVGRDGRGAWPERPGPQGQERLR